MSELKNKSDINYDSAKFLHDRGNYPSVGHCSYYSCYQLFKHIWLHVLNKSDSDLRLIIERSKNKRAQIKGSHDTLINEIEKFIKENNHSDFRVINSNIGQLKKLRHSADYENKPFLYDQSLKSIELSRTMRAILIKY